jgi:hypothetical protein
MFVKNYDLDYLYNMTGFFDIQEYHSLRYIIVEIQESVIRIPYTLKCPTVKCMETKLTYNKNISFSSMRCTNLD